MARKQRQSKPKRIAIAIELDAPYAHHYGCCRGILQYAAERGGWLTVIDPHLVGITGQGGPARSPTRSTASDWNTSNAAWRTRTPPLAPSPSNADFPSSGHFARFFRMMTGIRPKDYRKSIAKK